MISNRIDRENGLTMNQVTCSCDLRNALFAAVSLLVTLLLIYGNSFFGEWHFDDFNNIVDNRAVHVENLSWEEMQKTFYGAPRRPELTDAKRLFEWVLSPLPDDGKFHVLGKGPAVWVVERLK